MPARPCTCRWTSSRSTSAPGRGRSRGSTRASAHRARASTEPPVRASDPAGGGSGHAPFPPPAVARTAAVRKTAGMRVPVLLLLNGAPGAGKSTLAARLAGRGPLRRPAGARTAAVRTAAGVRVPVLLLRNGAPGAGKSTPATRLAARRPLALALDIDQLKHSPGGWEADLQSSGLQARRLALA